MAFPVFMVPGLFSYLLVNGLPLDLVYSWMFILMAFGITLAHYGLVLVSQTEDYPEDKEHGLITPPVAWGIKKAMSASYHLNLLGSLLIIITFIFFFYIQNPVMLPLVGIVALGRYLAMKDVVMLYKKGRTGLGQTAFLKAIRAEMHKYPDWHASGLIVITASSFLLILLRSITL